jgi:hypothetical protein
MTSISLLLLLLFLSSLGTVSIRVSIFNIGSSRKDALARYSPADKVVGAEVHKFKEIFSLNPLNYTGYVMH